ncbi:MAG: hypothetical protein AB8B63_02315 [Granulosicoccus sp.]
MNQDPSLEPYHSLFALPAEHTLVETRTQRVKQNGTVYETRWLDELDESRQPVSHFRAWANHSLQPPYRRQSGWERYSPGGALLDREIRYSQREDNDYVH